MLNSKCVTNFVTQCSHQECYHIVNQILLIKPFLLETKYVRPLFNIPLIFQHVSLLMLIRVWVTFTLFHLVTFYNPNSWWEYWYMYIM